jgi:AcrR family transcriptional regulator
MTDQRRPYRKKRRAELEADTRRRITESAVELHGTLGPSRTSISAVAEHAGVRRSTLYRHFPDEAALFAACTAHWMDSNPLPDILRWAAIDDPDERLREGLRELYAYYRRTQRMMDNLHRDEPAVPLVKQNFAGFRNYLVAAQETLMVGRRARGRGQRRMRGAVGHALGFPTWRSLVREQGLDNTQAAELMCRLVAVAS